MCLNFEEYVTFWIVLVKHTVNLYSLFTLQEVEFKEPEVNLSKSINKKVQIELKVMNLLGLQKGGVDIHQYDIRDLPGGNVIRSPQLTAQSQGLCSAAKNS